MLSRRRFVAMLGAASFAGIFGSGNQVPPSLDHIFLGCSQLERGIVFVREQTGVQAQFGGVHPGRGTQNALLSLGELHYLEIIAPDPNQPKVDAQASESLQALKKLNVPRLFDWAVRSYDIEALAKKLGGAGMAIEGPWSGSRTRPDGRVLHWKTLNLRGSHSTMLPFFIEWGTDSIHPSQDAPPGCRLERFVIAGPNPAELSSTFERLGLDVPVERAGRIQLRARITGPNGALEVTS